MILGPYPEAVSWYCIEDTVPVSGWDHREMALR